MGAKGQRQGWQKHSVDEYKSYVDDEQFTITADVDPELMYPDEQQASWVSYEEYWANWEKYNKEHIDDAD